MPLSLLTATVHSTFQCIAYGAIGLKIAIQLFRNNMKLADDSFKRAKKKDDRPEQRNIEEDTKGYTYISQVKNKQYQLNTVMFIRDTIIPSYNILIFETKLASFTRRPVYNACVPPGLT